MRPGISGASRRARGRIRGRDRELSFLDQSWERACTGLPQLVLVSGQRRVGKTFLASQFAAGKPSLWFGATNEAETLELGRLAQAVQRQLGSDQVTADAFETWQSALNFLGRLAAESPLLVVIDGAAALVRTSPTFVEAVDRLGAALLPGTRLMLVVVGIGPAALRPAAPAPPGWSVARLHLSPLDIAGARAMLPRLPPAEFLEAYAACGGYPLHLLQWDEEATTEENLLQLAGTCGGILIDDAEAILRDVLPDSGGYLRILSAIGRLQTRYSEILVAVDQRIDHALDVLCRVGLIQRSVPLGAAQGAPATEYELVDTYLGFWFRVLSPHIPEIEAGQGARELRRANAAWARHLGCTFQGAARAHAERMAAAGDLPADLVVGRWWSPTVRDARVDVLGLRGGRSYLVGEARWGEGTLGLGDVSELRGRLQRVPSPVAEPVLVLWGRKGVEPEVRRHALGYDVAAAIGE